MKLTGKKKAAFLARMAKGRRNKATSQGPKQRKAVKVKRKRTTNKSNNMARKKTSRRSKVTGFLNNPTLKKAMIGMGAASLAGTVVSMVAPQYAPIARPLAALAVGGPIGAVAAIVADGGLSSLGGIVGGITGQQQTSNGGLTV